MNSRRSIFHFVGLIIGCGIVVYLTLIGAMNILRMNDRADLHIYLAGAEDVAGGYFEPVSLLVFDLFRIVSNFVYFPLLLPVTVGLAVFITVFNSRSAAGLRFFWCFALVPLLSLVNTRLGLYFLFAPFLAPTLLKTVSVFLHWNFLSLFLFRRMSFRGALIIAFIAAIGYLVFFEYVQLAQAKLGFYLAQDSAYGVGVFFEIVLLAWGMHSLYKDRGLDASVFRTMIFAAGTLALVGLPTAASRIVSFSILVSFIDLRRAGVDALDRRTSLCLALVALYEIYLFGSKTEFISWTWY